MKETIAIYLMKDMYASRGFRFYCVDKESRDWCDRDEDMLFVVELTIDMPDTSKLVEFGLKQVERMKEDLQERIQSDTARIKEFESKFLLLE